MLWLYRKWAGAENKAASIAPARMNAILRLSTPKIMLRSDLPCNPTTNGFGNIPLEEKCFVRGWV